MDILVYADWIGMQGAQLVGTLSSVRTKERKGWILSPAYDVNPVYSGTGLTLNISENENLLDFDLALSVAPYFRVAAVRAGRIIKEVKKARDKWRDFATELSISRNEQELMESAFTEG